MRPDDHAMEQGEGCPHSRDDHWFCGGCARVFHLDVYALCPDCTHVPANRTADRARLWCRKAKPVSRPPSDSAGWIAPDGRFYPVDDQDHDGMGRVLARRFRLSSPGGKPDERGDLTLHGWLRLSQRGDLRGPSAATQPQLDTIFDLAMASKGQRAKDLHLQARLCRVE